MRFLSQLLTALLILSCALGSFAQDTAEGDHVQVRWLAPAQLAAGEPTTLGLYFEVDPHWHVYWHNAGDSGAAPKFDFETQNAQVGPVQWPFPTRLPIAHLTNLGYEGAVAYLFDVTPEAGVEQVDLTVNLEWLVCKVNCIPGFGTMSLTRPVGVDTRWQQPADRALIEQFQVRVPGAAGDSPWQVENLRPTGQDEVQLILRGPATTPSVFPVDGSALTAAEPVRAQDRELQRLTFKTVPGAPMPDATGFVVSDGQRAWRFDEVPVKVEATGGAVTPSEGAQPGLWILLLSAFAGGIILNLMPCVFPVLSIKLFGLVRQQDDDASARPVKEAALYSAGVLCTFAALGGLLLLLRVGGNAVGWGFQLQSAPVVLALILLFWLMGLSFSGVFEFGQRLMVAAGSAKSSSSFTTGVLAVFVAAPCTGPFMGVALGAAAVAAAPAAMGIFLALGAGLAAPFVLLALTPALLKRLPRPGPWMDVLRRALAFPLYATVIWLLWVLGRLQGESGWLLGAVLLLGISFALWLGQLLRGRWQAIGWATAVVVIVYCFGSLSDMRSDVDTQQDAWAAYDAELIAEAREEGRPVFVDFTAAWCITCQVNKKLVLESESVETVFEQNDVQLVRADWTQHDPAITKALAALGRNSVPVYVYYAPGAEQPRLLPQILQERMIIQLFNGDSS